MRLTTRDEACNAALLHANEKSLFELFFLFLVVTHVWFLLLTTTEYVSMSRGWQ